MADAAHRFNNALRYRDPTDERQSQYTPAWLVERIRDDVLGGTIELDPCTTDENPVDARWFYAPPRDGLREMWTFAKTIFVNPPYGKAREPWVRACVTASGWAHVVLLMPAHPDTRIFQYAAARAQHVCFLRGRMKFGVVREKRAEAARAAGKSDRVQAAASHPSVLFGFNADLSKLVDLGVVVAMIPGRMLY